MVRYLIEIVTYTTIENSSFSLKTLRTRYTPINVILLSPLWQHLPLSSLTLSLFRSLSDPQLSILTPCLTASLLPPSPSPPASTLRPSTFSLDLTPHLTLLLLSTPVQLPTSLFFFLVTLYPTFNYSLLVSLYELLAI